MKKTEQETQKAGSLQHCRQSGRLLKIAGNRHAAGSQRQKADFLGCSPEADWVKFLATYTAAKNFRLQKKKEKSKEGICPDELRLLVQRNYPD